MRPHARRARRGARRGRRPSSRRGSSATPRMLRAAVSERQGEEGARPALPRRRERPRRDRPPRRARARATSCSRSGRASACSPATSPPRVARVHAVELDASLEPHLAARRRTSSSHLGDALRLDLAALAPDATKLVANLPYNVATPLLVESLDGLPGIGLWCVMVQREVADRLFAVPGTKAYGAVSVLVQLAAERTGFHPVSRDGLPAAAERRLGARRLPPHRARRRLPAREGGRRGGVRAPAQDAPELARARRPRPARAGRRGARRDRPPARRRAEALAPPEFVALAEALA